mgnify:CR=1 FL=1
MHKGELREALDLLTRARTVTEHEPFSDLDRAEILFRLGVCRYKLSSNSTAIASSTRRTQSPSDPSCRAISSGSNILAYRSRCYRRQRDLEAAREDVERALELARSRSTTARRWPTCMSRRRSSPSAWATGSSPATTRSAQELLRGAERPAEPRRPAQQPRRAQPHARQARGGDRVSEVLVLDRARRRQQGGGRAGDRLLAAVHLELDDYEQAELFARQAISSSRVASTSSTRSARRSSSSAGRSWSRDASTRPKTRSRPRTTVLSSGPQPATAHAPGSRWATSPPVGATTARLHVTTAMPLTRSRTSGSRGRG